MQDVTPVVKYFRFAPKDLAQGEYQTPLGTFVTGQVIEASGAQLEDIERAVATGGGPFEKATKKQYEDQDLQDLAASLNQPYVGEEA